MYIPIIFKLKKSIYIVQTLVHIFVYNLTIILLFKLSIFYVINF